MNKQKMKLPMAVVLVAAGLQVACGGGVLKTRVLQPPYAADAKGESASSQWLLDEFGNTKRHVTADEHGIGFAKKPFLVESLASEGRALLCGIKRIFDPEGILNPHKVVS